MRSVIIGLDGADWQVMEPLMNSGKLPIIKALADRGCRGTLYSTIPPNSPPAWASLITGVNPGKHGIFDFTSIDGNYRKVPLEIMKKLRVAPLWRILNARRITTGIVNLPISYPPEPVDGYLVCGMVTPWSARVFTYPDRLSRLIGDPKKNWIIGEHLSRDSSLEDFFLEIRNKTRRQAEFVIEMTKVFETSFLMVVFDGTDKIQHYFWKFWDPTHPRHDPNANRVLRCAIEIYYVDLDTYIGQLLDRLGERDIFLVSDHGFMSNSQDFYIDKWLLEEGYLNRTVPPAEAHDFVIRKFAGGVSRSATSQKLFNIAKKYGPLRRFGQKAKAKMQQTAIAGDNIDWEKTKAYFAGVSSQSIRINLKGREKYGIVESGEEYTNLVGELRSRLTQLRDTVSGSPVIKEVYLRDEIFHGPGVIDAPDLVVMTEEGYLLQEGFPDRVLKPSMQYGLDRSGSHRRNGIFLACGPNIRHRAKPLEAQIVDIVPTILYLGGLAIPNYADGGVMNEIIREDYLQSHSVERTSSYEEIQGGIGDMTEEEKKLIEEHLRALGYF